MKKLISLLLVIILVTSLGGLITVAAEEKVSPEAQTYIDSAFDKAISDGIILGYTALKNPLERSNSGFNKQYDPKGTCTRLQASALFQRIFLGKFEKYPTGILALAGIDKGEGSLPANTKFINKLLADNQIDFVLATKSETGKDIGSDSISREMVVCTISDIKNALFSEE